MPARPRGLLIGRFQPFHLGHLALVRHIRSQRAEAALLLGIGSAQESFTRENPFTAAERAEMIERALRGAQLDGVTAMPVVDIDRHALWVAHVESIVPRFDLVYTNNPLTRLLFEKAGYTVELPPLMERDRFEGAQLRLRLARGEGWEDRVPAEVAQYLKEIGAEARMKLLYTDRNPESAV